MTNAMYKLKFKNKFMGPILNNGELSFVSPLKKLTARKLIRE